MYNKIIKIKMSNDNKLENYNVSMIVRDTTPKKAQK
jgi:hypothetical protein